MAESPPTLELVYEAERVTDREQTRRDIYERRERGTTPRPEDVDFLKVELEQAERERDEWMTPFDGDGIAWHESLPSPYTYQASDFSKLLAAVHQYEARLKPLVEEMTKVLDCFDPSGFPRARSALAAVKGANDHKLRNHMHQELREHDVASSTTRKEDAP